MELNKELIVNEARQLGFSLAGFTTPEPAAHLSEYERWLMLGRHGDMGYMADPRRRDPHLLLPGCQSILVLAMPYQVPEDADRRAAVQGRVAAYARGRDYHIVLVERMQALVTWIERRVGKPVAHRICVDSSPLLERDLAQRAGLGWIGRNTCLINPVIGSFFFLAEILLGIEFDPDPPFTVDRCGTCRRCLDICPTGALLPERMMDARRCISYLTIENKYSIPPELRPNLGSWIFGCDLCQTVCPWNHHPQPAADPAFLTGHGAAAIDLCADLGITPDEFKLRFKDSPIQRAKRSGYVRNIAVALGNAGNRQAATALEKALQDEDALVREHAAWALERIQTRWQQSS